MIADLDVERARRADRLLEELLELPESEREARIRALCSEDAQLAALVDRLLRAAEEDGRGDDAGSLAGTSDAADLAERAIGALVGAWRIEKPLGRGGMSRVFVAERVQGGFRQRAALKLFERSPVLAGGLVQRFEQERQILATLDHPNIARVLDGGVAADGRPYLVLELIEGETLDRWCELHDPPLARRLEVFVAAARAVQHAHRHLIVHRDLKPSNLLVTPQGVVKLLDFGIAKVLAGSEALAGSGVLRATTLTSSRPLTPAYASPEQVRGEPIQTSSDIYQLGLLLYELLAGRPAHLFREDSWRELERVVCETDPEPLVERRLKAKSAESRTRSVPPELETVVRKALQKDPARRYGSADHLADDVVRFLNDEPVLARPDTLTYRARKFVRRHRFATAATVCILLSLAAGGWATAWQAREAARQRDAARLAAEKSQSALELLLDVFQIADEGGGGAVTARELVERSVARVQSEPTSDRLRADRLEVLARADEGLGLTAAAAKLRAEIVAITRREDGSESLQLARELDRLGSTLVLAGDYQEAISRLEEALRLQSTALGEENPDTLTTSSHLSYALGVKGDVRRSLALRERVLAARRRIHGESSAEVAQASNDVGRSLRFLGRTEEAEQHLRRAIDLRRGLDGATAPSVSVPLSNLGHALLDRGAFAEAEAVATEALELSQRAVRAGHPSLAGRFHLMGSVRLAERRLREAEEYFRQALELYRSVLPPTHFSIAETELSLAEALWLDERPRDAEALARAADERLRRSFSEGGFRVGQADALLGACWAANGGGSAAIRLAEAGYGAIVRELGEASPVAARARFHLDAARRASKGQGSSPASGS